MPAYMFVRCTQSQGWRRGDEAGEEVGDNSQPASSKSQPLALEVAIAMAGRSVCSALLALSDLVGLATLPGLPSPGPLSLSFISTTPGSYRTHCSPHTDLLE